MAIGIGVDVGTGVALGATDGTTVGVSLGTDVAVRRLAAVGTSGGMTIGKAATACGLFVGTPIAGADAALTAVGAA